MKVATTYNNFARGQLDHDMQGRFDLPIYTTGADIIKNFITNFKGNAKYRTGWEQLFVFEDCAFIPFKFNKEQNYIVVAFANKFRFLSYDSNGEFGWVLDGGASILEVATPYTLAQAKEIGFARSFTQNFDVMYIAHPTHAVRRLRRTSATEFKLEVASFKDNPFDLTYDGTKNITAITKAAEAQLTITAHGYSVGDQILIDSVGGMTEINDYTLGVIEVVDANNVKVSLNTTDFTTYTSGGTSAKVLTSDQPRTTLFYKGRLYFAATDNKPTTIWASESANYDLFTLPSSVTDTSALQFTPADIAQKIEWLFAGDNSLLAGAFDGILAVNGGEVGKAITADTVEATLTSADGCNGAYPFTKDGLIFYIDNTSRRMLYFSYDLLTETFVAKDANIISYDITKGGITKLAHKQDREDITYALNDNGTWQTCNFNAEENIVGWHTHSTPTGLLNDMVIITDNEGMPQVFGLSVRDSVYYIERQAEYVEFAPRVDFFSETKTLAQKSGDNEAYYRYIAEQLKLCNYLDNSEIVSNLQEGNTITYDSGAGTITANSAVFSSGDVGKQIVYKTLTGYESGRFEITGYTSTTVVDVDVLQDPTSNTYDDWYLTFSVITGLASGYNGDEKSVVADGGYIGEYTVSGGEIDLNAQVTHAIVGDKYTGIIKSFSLGFQLQQYQTQMTMKVLNRIGMRCTTSLGGKFGSDYYRLTSVQKLKQGDLNYLPPLPIDGTEYVTITDTGEFDKYFYIVQDEPLPLVVNSVMIEAQYSVGG